jgi:hypothetical protein
VTSFIPPAVVARAASRALRWREKRPAAGTRVGWTRANQLANYRPVSLQTVKRMKAYFDRHQVDSEAMGWYHHERGFPTNGRVMWDAWGGNDGRLWVEKIIEEEKKK